MIYLSRLLLNLRDRQVQHDLADVQQLHRTILNAFPAAPEGTKAREHFGVLFRSEPVPEQPRLARLLVQSTHVPDWSHLLSGYLAPPDDERPNPAVRPLTDYDRITIGMTLRFRLRANPTKRISKFTTKQKDLPWVGKRIELRREADQIRWIEQKAEQSGFRLQSVATHPELANMRISPQAKVVGNRDAAPKMTFGVALFDGLLQVQDVEQFTHTLVAGIGSGKAYGFGLLSIASASEVSH